MLLTVSTLKFNALIIYYSYYCRSPC